MFIEGTAEVVLLTVFKNTSVRNDIFSVYGLYSMESINSYDTNMPIFIQLPHS